MPFLDNSSETNVYCIQSMMKFLGRLGFEDVESFYHTLGNLSLRFGVSDYKYILLSNFYSLVKVSNSLGLSHFIHLGRNHI